ncbi:hypothetical protein AGMMS4956_00600 [Bacteroidia bacterium]|nr:hypothetical protein AGMMS4956_00600 [Bacteroidia bacterium]
MLNTLKNYIKIVIVCMLRIILRVFWILPIKKNRIFFDAYNGNYTCNPKYIFEYLYRQYGSKVEYVWCLKDKALLPNIYQNVKSTKNRHWSYFYYLLTSKVYVSNSGIPAFVPIKKSQLFIDTTHGGGAYKKVGITESEKANKKYGIFTARLVAKETSYVIASCKKYTEVIANVNFVSKDNFLPIGMPRNDMFFVENKERVQPIKKQLNLQEKTGIVLYAPTFRGSMDNAWQVADIDVEKLLRALTNRFGKDFMCLFRSHYFVEKKHSSRQMMDVSTYPDMQELLLIADVLITDYSSSIWDFSFTGRPCFLYAPDLAAYKSERDFYTPIESWPFPLAETNEQLEQNILNFSQEKYAENVKRHHKELGSFEKGTATESICNLIGQQLF